MGVEKVLTACALIYKKIANTDCCLMTRRSFKSEFLPGMYELPGGHIESNESEIDGLVREIKEELNLDIEVGNIFDSFTYFHKGKLVVENICLATSISLLSE